MTTTTTTTRRREFLAGFASATGVSRILANKQWFELTQFSFAEDISAAEAGGYEAGLRYGNEYVAARAEQE